ncbi:MAG: hypothetical protein ACRDRH_11295 [Pseudonocardia sp.]
MRRWRRLLAPLQPELVTTGRVRMRRLICACCGRRTRVEVGPPRCLDCAGEQWPATRSIPK